MGFGDGDSVECQRIGVTNVMEAVGTRQSAIGIRHSALREE